MPQFYNRAGGASSVTPPTPINSQPIPRERRRGKVRSRQPARCPECELPITEANPRWSFGCWDCTDVTYDD